tara:strand:+ start:1225 stop:2250 length:1026 start_codon:yes stop_codon:yes gene_type:complete
MLIPTHIKPYEIYDVFHANGYFIIITPINVKSLGIFLNKQQFIRSVISTQTYRLQGKYTEFIDLCIDGTEIHNVKVNVYPDVQDEIVLTTMVKNEDNYIRQWIEYHLLIGFTTFIIYDNANSIHCRYQSDETSSDLVNVLDKYIQLGQVILVEWNYPKAIECVTTGQYAQQQHSLLNCKSARYMAFFDIDEYINITNCSDPYNIINSLDSIITDKVAGVQIWCKFMQNCSHKNEDNYEFLKITDYFYCINGDQNKPRYDGANSPKFIVKPDRVCNCAVHNYHPTNKYKHFKIKNYDSLYFNHFYFLNKKSLCGRWRNRKKCIYIDDTLIKYYDKLVEQKLE